MIDALSDAVKAKNNPKPTRKVVCHFCGNKPAIRLSSWTVACDSCSLANALQYDVNDPRLLFRNNKDRFPKKHSGVKFCRACKGNHLIILYDEVDDEWLYCGACNNFKQLLRCWNLYTNTMVDYLDRPICRSSSDATMQVDEDFIEDNQNCSPSEMDNECSDQASVASSVLEPVDISRIYDDLQYIESDNTALYFDDLPTLVKNVDGETAEDATPKKTKSKNKKKKSDEFQL